MLSILLRAFCPLPLGWLLPLCYVFPLLVLSSLLQLDGIIQAFDKLYNLFDPLVVPAAPRIN